MSQRAVNPSAELCTPTFEWGSQAQICEALRDSEVRDRQSLGLPRFDELAWAPRLGERLATPLELERTRGRLAQHAANQGQPKWRATSDDVSRAVRLVAQDFPFHPVADRLSALVWDRTPRLSRAATEVLGVDPEIDPAAASLVRKWFIGAVTRAFRPCCPMDPVLTLMGLPSDSVGLFFRLLVPPEEYSDAPTPLASEATRDELRRAWIWDRADLPTLAGDKPAELAMFLARTHDEVGREGEKAPRTTLLVASVESVPPIDHEPLRRRLWLIRTGTLNATLLSEWADQLWAEAVHAFLAGETWRASPDEERGLVNAHAILAEPDPIESAVLRYLQRMDITQPPSLAELLRRVLDLKPAEQPVALVMRIARFLRRNGYTSRRVLVGDSRQTLWYPARMFEGPLPGEEDEDEDGEGGE
jgi:hypothetical protein